MAPHICMALYFTCIMFIFAGQVGLSAERYVFWFACMIDAWFPRWLVKKTLMLNCRLGLLSIILNLQSIKLKNVLIQDLSVHAFLCHISQFLILYMKNSKHSQHGKLCVIYLKLSCEYKTWIVTLVGTGITGPWERITVCHIFRRISLVGLLSLLRRPLWHQTSQLPGSSRICLVYPNTQQIGQKLFFNKSCLDSSDYYYINVHVLLFLLLQ